MDGVVYTMVSSTPRTHRGTAFLVENPDEAGDEVAPTILAAEDAEVRAPDADAHADGRSPAVVGNPGQLTIGNLHMTPADPYQASDKAVANERHALDMQYQAMTKGYENANGRALGEVDAQMEAVHETYASYDAAGSNSAALKAAIAQQDAEVKRRIEQHAGGAPLLEGYDPHNVDDGENKRDGKQTSEADAFLRRMAELDAAIKRGVAEHDRIQF